MSRPYDFLVVGAGLFGATCAYELTKRGFKCLVLEQRSHCGGNCYTESRDGINVHLYGPHIFHTSNAKIWDWVCSFCSFNNYRHQVVVNYNGKLYSFPPNLWTFQELWGIQTPEAAIDYLRKQVLTDADPSTLEGYALSRLGKELYDIFVRGYSQKQWGKPPALLPASIIKRIPLRFTFDDHYFNDKYEGIPIGGYTQIFSKLLAGADVRLRTDYFSDRSAFDTLAHRVIYTGPLDRFFNYSYGKLEYRTLRIEHQCYETEDYQGIAQMNYTSETVPYTRVTEHKHFESGKQPVTWVSREFPAADRAEGHEMYPVRDTHNLVRANDYLALSRLEERNGIYFGGRLASYQYYDMHQVIGAALGLVSRLAAYHNQPIVDGALEVQQVHSQVA